MYLFSVSALPACGAGRTIPRSEGFCHRLLLHRWAGEGVLPVPTLPLPCVPVGEEQDQVNPGFPASPSQLVLHFQAESTSEVKT